MKPKPSLRTLPLIAAASLLAAKPASAVDYTSYTNNTNLTLASGDTLTVSSGNVDISYGGSGTGIGARTLDASLADSVTFDIGSLRIGTRSDPGNTSTSNLNGTLNLGADNTITASTIVSIAGGGHLDGGSLTTAANSATVIDTPTMDIGTLMRSSGSLTTGSGSTLTVQGISGDRTALTVGQERNASSGINWSSSGTMNLSGGQATLKLSSLLVGSSLFASSENGTASGTLTMSSNTANQLDISGAGSVVQVGASSGNQTTGTITIGNLGSASAITSTNNGTAILIGDRVTGTGDVVTGTLSLNGGTVTITTTGAAIAGGSNATSNLNLAGGVTLKAGATSTNWITNLDTAVINAGGAVIDTNTHNIGISQAFSGAGGLTKAGDGILTLSTTHSYAGPTNVTGGTLVVDGNISTSSLTTIGTGATLEGIGTVGDLTIAANAFHNPGNSPGIMDTGDYIMAGTLTAEILGLNPGTQHDQVDVTGTVNLSGSLVASFGGGTYSEDDLIFLLLNNDTDAITGTFSNYDNGDIVANYGGFDWQISYFADFDGTPTFTGGNDVALLALSTIPEPGAALLGSLGALLLLRRRRVA